LTSYDVKYGYPSKALHLGSDEQPLFLLDVALDGEQLTITARDEPTPSRARVSDFLVDDFSSPVIVRRNEQGSLRVTETAPKPPVSKASVIGKPKTSVLEEDPIIFTSSPDYGRAARQKKPINESRKGKGLLDLDPLSSDVEVVVTTRKSTSLRVEAFSSDDLPDIDALVSQDVGRVPTLSRKGSKRALAEYEAEKEKVSKRKERLDEKDSPKKPRKKLTEEEKAQAAQEKLDAKEAEKERKRLARDDKARAKQMAADLAKVNTLRIHKSQATPEMIIDLPLDLEARLAEQVRQFLAPLEVECTDRSSPIPNVVRWRRKVEAIYNKDKDYWEPCRKHIQDEEHVLCVMTAKEFVERATAAEGHDLDAHVLRMQAAFSGKTIIYLLEGLTSWMRKNRNVRNKQFTEAVRAQLDTSTAAAPPSSSSSGRAKKPPPQYIDEDLLEDALLRLQVIHHTLIHHTAAPIETAEWLRAFTQHVATVPYRRARLRVEADAGFCMEAGQISVGVDASDTFVQMLLQVARVTAPVAYAVRDRYGSVQGLIKGFEREGRDCLAEVRKNVHDGGVSGMVESERRIGVRMSRRLYAIFMGRDERSEDI
jgi:crossover junction endonuclease EME1